MESMNQIVQFDGIDFSTLPSVEVCPKVKQSFPQFPVVGNAGPLTNQTFDPLRGVVHKTSCFLSAELRLE